MTLWPSLCNLSKGQINDQTETSDILVEMAKWAMRPQDLKEKIGAASDGQKQLAGFAITLERFKSFAERVKKVKNKAQAQVAIKSLKLLHVSFALWESISESVSESV